MKWLVTIIFFFCTHAVLAQERKDTIKLHFLYGSVPAPGYKNVERKLFGGIKGGHVNIEANGKVMDFMPGNPCAIVPDNTNPTGGYRLSNSLYWDTATTKWTTVRIPVSSEQLNELEKLFSSYSQKTPYDYAVFGMRCAAASYDLLSEIGLFRKMSLKNNIITNFYPKLLRKRILKWAKKNNYPVEHHQGRSTRKWESDEGII
jgi:hypothetical protein